MQEIQTTLKNLASSFAKYFPSLDTGQYEWVMNPFVNYEDTCLTMAEEENLIDLKNDLVYKASLAELELSAFWISLQSQYPLLSYKAIKCLPPFGSSYLCEYGFSARTEIKSKKEFRHSQKLSRKNVNDCRCWMMKCVSA